MPGPDLMVISADDYENTARTGTYFQGRPLFVIEEISPSEKKSRRLQKVGLFLEAGAGAVVEVVYGKKAMFVYRPDEDAALTVTERIDWLFVAPVAEIFAGI